MAADGGLDAAAAVSPQASGAGPEPVMQTRCQHMTIREPIVRSAEHRQGKRSAAEVWTVIGSLWWRAAAAVAVNRIRLQTAPASRPFKLQPVRVTLESHPGDAPREALRSPASSSSAASFWTLGVLGSVALAAADNFTPCSADCSHA